MELDLSCLYVGKTERGFHLRLSRKEHHVWDAIESAEIGADECLWFEPSARAEAAEVGVKRWLRPLEDEEGHGGHQPWTRRPPDAEIGIGEQRMLPSMTGAYAWMLTPQAEEKWLDWRDYPEYEEWRMRIPPALESSHPTNDLRPPPPSAMFRKGPNQE